MSMQDPNRPARPRPGQSAPASRPATPIIAVVIAAVAGLIGLIVLRDVKSDAGNTNSDTTEITDTTEPTDDTTFTDDSSVPDVTLPVLVRTGAIVVVSNASGKKGAAGALTDELKARGYDAGRRGCACGRQVRDGRDGSRRHARPARRERSGEAVRCQRCNHPDPARSGQGRSVAAAACWRCGCAQYRSVHNGRCRDHHHRFLSVRRGAVRLSAASTRSIESPARRTTWSARTHPVRRTRPRA